MHLLHNVNRVNRVNWVHQDRDYQNLAPGSVQNEILRCARKHIFFLDNNFFGNDSRAFDAKLSMLRSLHSDGRLHDWSAEVTADFFARGENLDRARAAGCSALFCGVESMDPSTLHAFDKKQNTVCDTPEMMRLPKDVFLRPHLRLTRRTQASIESSSTIS
jgi:radical SAM superfamily enzyme YgiQ (UPF0313 family)